MNVFQLELSSYEVAARKLFNKALDEDNGGTWSSLRVMIAHVFVDNSSSALSLNSIVNHIVAANHAARTDDLPDIVRKGLTSYVREGVLRSRRAGSGAFRPSETLWEVNFS